MKAFIFHGTKSSPKENWFPWLKKELEKLGWEVIIPEFPTPDNQSLTAWLNRFEKYLPSLDENTILIGHSLGCPFMLSLLEISKKPVNACFLIAAFYQLIGKKEYDDLNSTFVEKQFDFEKIRKMSGEFYLYYSDSDPYINPDQPNELQEKLAAELIYIEEAGHFNSESGYTKFEELLEKIKEIKSQKAK